MIYLGTTQELYSTHNWGNIKNSKEYNVQYRVCENNCGLMTYHYCEWHINQGTCEEWALWEYCSDNRFHLFHIYSGPKSIFDKLSCNEIIMANVL
jgi:hypothetical protein